MQPTWSLIYQCLVGAGQLEEKLNHVLQFLFRFFFPEWKQTISGEQKLSDNKTFLSPGVLWHTYTESPSSMQQVQCGANVCLRKSMATAQVVCIQSVCHFSMYHIKNRCLNSDFVPPVKSNEYAFLSKKKKRHKRVRCRVLYSSWFPFSEGQNINHFYISSADSCV